ncbi:hypothetical protein [Kribbella sp. NPDC006257]|uniref:LysM peptidoglycan-binding domain-containing protein n=1 Tax=Kribbella sp. NPDC006257 TaxID=3156738 RepID=UPI0033B1F02C
MNAMIRGLRVLLAAAALTAAGLGLRWTTAGAVSSASTRDLTSMAFLTVGAVAWIAYAWLLIAVLATLLEQTPGAIGSAASLVAGRITSKASRALLRSTLGLAAVTPLTIGVAHATPTTAVPTADWALAKSPSTLRPTTPTPWRTPESPSSLGLTKTPPTAHPGKRATAAHPDHPSPQPTLTADNSQHPITARLSQRPSIQPTSAADASQRPAVPAKPLGRRPGVPESPADFRATEKASTLRLTDAPATEQRTTVAHPGGRPSAQPVPAADASQRPAVPVKTLRPPGVPESPGDFRAIEKASTLDLGADARPDQPKAGRVAIPDRPTEGAPTRYTDLRSGHRLRTATHVVRHGDTLWGLAAAELGPDATDFAIAARWPHWYAANRTLIGPNPDLLHPGQVLHIPPPSAHHPVPPTHQEK